VHQSPRCCGGSNCWKAAPRAALPAVHRYRSHTVQPSDTAALTVWVSPAGGVTAPPGASSYSGDPARCRGPGNGQLSMHTGRDLVSCVNNSLYML